MPKISDLSPDPRNANKGTERGLAVLRRLSMPWKVDTGTSASDIVRKELSLAGYQRPINPSILEEVGIRFFQIGEFSGWVIEKSE